MCKIGAFTCLDSSTLDPEGAPRAARIEGRGGLVAVDAKGNVVLPFNTEGMYRGFARVGDAPVTAIYR